MGLKRALINNKGNLIIIVKIIVFEGVSDGGTDRIALKQENEKDAIIIPRIIIPM
jgi:hypothetical protein